MCHQHAGLVGSDYPLVAFEKSMRCTTGIQQQGAAVCQLLKHAAGILHTNGRAIILLLNGLGA